MACEFCDNLENEFLSFFVPIFGAIILASVIISFVSIIDSHYKIKNLESRIEGIINLECLEKSAEEK